MIDRSTPRRSSHPSAIPLPVRRCLVLVAGLAAISGVLPVVAAEPDAARGKPARDLRFVVFHTTGPNWQPGKTLFEQPDVREHVSHYRKLLEAGKLAWGGPHPDPKGGGMMVAKAGVTEAELVAFAAEDPAVKSGVLRFEVRPWIIGMGG